MTIAQDVLALMAKYSFAASSLPMGYGVTYDHGRVFFPQCRQIQERRNKKGRCTLSIVQYADGSKVKFTYSESIGGRYSLTNKES